MQLKSPSFENNQSIPEKFTCDGEDVNPPLEIIDVPEVAESLALVVHDPDAPSGDWVHWVVWNIDPAIEEIFESNIPEGSVEGTNDFGGTGYGGPCPPSGEHRYVFNLYALDCRLELTLDNKREDLEKAMEGHIIDKAELTCIYRR